MGRRSKAQLNIYPGLCSLTIWILACSFICMDETTALTQRLLSVFQKGSEVSSAPPARCLADWKYSQWKVLITVAAFKVWCYDLGWSGPPISGRCCGCYSLTGAVPKWLTSQSSLRRPFCALTGDPGCIWLPWNTCSSVSPLSWEFRWCRFSNCIVALLMHTKFLPALASVVVFSVPGFRCAVAAQTQSWPRGPELECE